METMTKNSESSEQPSQSATLNETLDCLRGKDVMTRVHALNAIAQAPRYDATIVLAVEHLLADTSACLASIPYTFSEVRYVAGRALQSLRLVAGIKTPVTIINMVIPLAAADLLGLMDDAGMKLSGGLEAQMQAFETLAASGKLPRRDYTFPQ